MFFFFFPFWKSVESILDLSLVTLGSISDLVVKVEEIKRISAFYFLFYRGNCGATIRKMRNNDVFYVSRKAKDDASQKRPLRLCHYMC